MYYEIEGVGEPLVLLHGGVGASEMFGVMRPALAENRQVISVHLQGHGQTVDTDRPLRFETMADDVVGLLAHIGIEKADIVGYSLGGGVALQAAIRHPEAVRKLVLISTPFQRDGFYPEVLENMAQMGPASAQFMSQSPLAGLYPNKDWGQLFTKLGELLRRDYDWSMDVVALKPQVMLVYADADAVQTAHIFEFFALLGGGKRDAGMDGSSRPQAQLAILPGMTHYDVLTYPALAGVIENFLVSPLPAAK
jgi:pimeloyl-ACP methyl ester carboxylesterase